MEHRSHPGKPSLGGVGERGGTPVEHRSHPGMARGGWGGGQGEREEGGGVVTLSLQLDLLI